MDTPSGTGCCGTHVAQDLPHHVLRRCLAAMDGYRGGDTLYNQHSFLDHSFVTSVQTVPVHLRGSRRSKAG